MFNKFPVNIFLLVVITKNHYTKFSSKIR